MLANYDESPTNSDLMQARDSRDDIAGTVVHLIERQCDQNPERTAVRFNADELTYGELERRSNQLAHYLRKRGVQRGKLVGICIHRSLEMVVGLLGILKAGGAYVPLDADYPEERIRYMMEQSAAPVLLTESALLGTLPGGVDLCRCGEGGHRPRGHRAGGSNGKARRSRVRHLYLGFDGAAQRSDDPPSRSCQSSAIHCA